MFHEDIFDCLSSDNKEAISKEMIKENFIVRAEDGGYLIPPMKILKKYTEQELEARILITKRLSSPRKIEKQNSLGREGIVQFKEETFPGMGEALNKVKELTKALKAQQKPIKKVIPNDKEDVRKFMDQIDKLTSIVTPQNLVPQKSQGHNQESASKNKSPPISSSDIPYGPAQPSQIFMYQCFYCLKKGNSVTRCNYLAEDLEKRILRKTGNLYFFPNFQREATEGTKIPNNLVREFAAEQELPTKKLLEDRDKVKPKNEEPKKETTEEKEE
ncbi:hypothetical protein O181_002142 [Austropuccinia psidii MF-1]|uniref:Uncharacterized protein n=1 Tax=Austropuccinia psidii MF-1 TaxID=1389203 RepID=A0A9Q3BBW9_9BASI|nr:hypothetical protein [Austropuccinia psidii MF-1]